MNKAGTPPSAGLIIAAQVTCRFDHHGEAPAASPRRHIQSGRASSCFWVPFDLDERAHVGSSLASCELPSNTKYRAILKTFEFFAL